MKQQQDVNKKEKEKSFTGVLLEDSFCEGIADIAIAGVDLVSKSKVVDFLKDKFQIVGTEAIELASRLPQTVVEKIESFDGEGLKGIAESVVESIKSIDLPDFDFPDIDLDL